LVRNPASRHSLWRGLYASETGSGSNSFHFARHCSCFGAQTAFIKGYGNSWRHIKVYILRLRTTSTRDLGFCQPGGETRGSEIDTRKGNHFILKSPLFRGNFPAGVCRRGKKRGYPTSPPLFFTPFNSFSLYIFPPGWLENAKRNALAWPGSSLAPSDDKGNVGCWPDGISSSTPGAHFSPSARVKRACELQRLSEEWPRKTRTCLIQPKIEEGETLGKRYCQLSPNVGSQFKALLHLHIRLAPFYGAVKKAEILSEEATGRGKVIVSHTQVSESW